jgi:hypothetical protein
MLGRLKQSFGRNATDVCASTARSGTALTILPGIDTSNCLTQLRSADGSDIAAGARTDHNNIKFI